MAKYVVTQQEFLEWKDSNVTKAFMKALRNDYEYLKEAILEGTDNDEAVRGRAKAVSQILSMSYEDLLDAMKENRYE